MPRSSESREHRFPARSIVRRASIGTEVRRILLRRTRYHVYYTCDPESGSAVIRAVWHAARGRTPRLR